MQIPESLNCWGELALLSGANNVGIHCGGVVICHEKEALAISPGGV